MSAFVEYNHMDFGASNVHFVAPAGLVPPGEVIRVRQETDVVLVGINFRFGADREYARLK
jgi:hypothetical protein